MTHTEALKMALTAKVANIMEQAQVFASAWSLVGGRFDSGHAMDDAEVAKRELHQMVAEALAEQLAQPQQEPNLAEAFRTELDKLSQRNYELRMENAQLKSQPHPWVGLTDEEVVNCWPGIMLHPDCAEFWKNIEAKLKAKNEL